MDIDKELNNILGKRDEYKDVVEDSDTPSYLDSIVDSKMMNEFIESELESIKNLDDVSPEDVVNMEPHDRVAMSLEMLSAVETDAQPEMIHDLFDDELPSQNQVEMTRRMMQTADDVAESQPKNETNVWAMPHELNRPDTQISRFNDGLMDESKPKMDFGPTWEERHEAYKQSLKESDIINRGATDLTLEDEGPEL